MDTKKLLLLPRLYRDNTNDPTVRIARCLAEYTRRYDEVPTLIEVRAGDVPEGYTHPLGIIVRTSHHLMAGDVLIYPQDVDASSIVIPSAAAGSITTHGAAGQP